MKTHTITALTAEQEWMVNDMISGMLTGLIVAWVLTFFDINKICIEVLQPFCKITLTDAHYYFALGFLGMIAGAFDRSN